MIQPIDIKKQYNTLKKDIDYAIRKVFNAGWFILGEQLRNFEREFADYCNVKYAVGVGSGTEAIHLALLAVGVKPGDEVITVPNTAVFTVSAITFAHATPIFVDINPKEFTMDAAKLEKKITTRTKVILPVHLYGQCANMAEIMRIAKKHKVSVIEDACQAHGAEFRGKISGSMGTAGCFSFYPSKNLGCYGDGGMITTNSKTVAEKLQLLRNGGQKIRYHHVVKGFNSRLDEIQASILRVKLSKLDKFNKKRIKIADIYNKNIKTPLVEKPQANPESKHVYHQYVVRCGKRDNLQKYLAEHGIVTLIHYPIPVHLQKAYSDLKLKTGSYPVAEKYAKEILSLPMYPELTNNEVNTIVKTINNFKGN